jgi:hypothetical protein
MGGEPYRHRFRELQFGPMRLDQAGGGRQRMENPPSITSSAPVM